MNYNWVPNEAYLKFLAYKRQSRDSYPPHSADHRAASPTRGSSRSRGSHGRWGSHGSLGGHGSRRRPRTGLSTTPTTASTTAVKLKSCSLQAFLKKNLSVKIDNLEYLSKIISETKYFPAITLHSKIRIHHVQDIINYIHKNIVFSKTPKTLDLPGKYIGCYCQYSQVMEILTLNVDLL